MKEHNFRQICIIGPSGTGKTALAEYLSRRFMIPYKTGSSRVITQSFGIKNQTGFMRLCANEQDIATEVYLKILENRLQILSLGDYYNPIVTDRGIIDLLVYAYLQLIPYLTIVERGNLIEKIRTSFTDEGIKFIFIPYTPGRHIENNNHRVDNHIYQNIVSNIFEMIIGELQPKYILTLPMWDWTIRVEQVEDIFDIPHTIESMHKAIIDWTKSW